MNSSEPWRSFITEKQKRRAFRVIDHIVSGLNNEIGGKVYEHNLEHAHFPLLLEALQQLCPNSNRDRVVHQQLVLAAKHNENVVSLGLFGGLCQLGLTLELVNRRCGRYSELLEKIDKFIDSKTDQQIDKVLCGAESGSIRLQDYDLISGLTGIGAYLLSRTQIRAPTSNSLHCIMTALVRICDTDNNGFLLCKTQKEDLIGWLAEDDRCKSGIVNCGVAHGIAGILCLLSLAKLSNISITGIEETITRLGTWLIGISNEHGWPDVVSLESNVSHRGCMDAWCYGSLGASRSLWLAGQAVGNLQWMFLAQTCVIESIDRVLRTSMTDAGICHGLSGALLIALRFANETNPDLFQPRIQQLFERVLLQFDPKTKFGFVDKIGPILDNPSFLTGACGIGLVLLASASEKAPIWDRNLLIA